MSAFSINAPVIRKINTSGLWEPVMKNVPLVNDRVQYNTDFNVVYPWVSSLDLMMDQVVLDKQSVFAKDHPTLSVGYVIKYGTTLFQYFWPHVEIVDIEDDDPRFEEYALEPRPALGTREDRLAYRAFLMEELSIGVDMITGYYESFMAKDRAVFCIQLMTKTEVNDSEPDYWTNNAVLYVGQSVIDPITGKCETVSGGRAVELATKQWKVQPNGN